MKNKLKYVVFIEEEMYQRIKKELCNESNYFNEKELLYIIDNRYKK